MLHCCSDAYSSLFYLFFFFNDTATTEIYTLSLHDALPISSPSEGSVTGTPRPRKDKVASNAMARATCRSEEHTSELQSRRDLVCRLLLEKKKDEQFTQPPRLLPWLVQFTQVFWHVFFFNDAATTEIYTLSLHDALPIQREQL